MPEYAKFMKDLLSRKGKTEETSKITLNEKCSAVLLNKIPFKEKDLGSFTIPCVIGKTGIDKALADLGPTLVLFHTLFIISSLLNSQEKELHLMFLTQHKAALAWKVAYIKGINPSFCTHKILMEDNFKPVVQPQRRLNPKVQDVVKAEIVKLLDSGLIYAILVSPWVSPIHVVPKKGIVLGHKISKSGIEVDRAKIKVIAKLPYLINVKGVRSFFGHEGFYQRFIKNFSKIALPMTQMFMKDAKFIFSNECMIAFNILKYKLTFAPVIIAPDWNLDFVLMCDISDYAVGGVLGQRIDKKFRPIYYASKTMNDAQEHYTTTEKELLAQTRRKDKAYKMGFKDKKGTKNLAIDHLSRLENPDLETLNEDAIRDSFLDEHLMAVQVRKTAKDPWLKLFLGKLKSRWYGPYTISKVFPYGKWRRVVLLCGNKHLSGRNHIGYAITDIITT
uniref:Reverse transcriptase/retrotransposon-derived protein RNase H-like domain-containing protein n=1 Tax=Tanacetum cinerariifolium TaxID=118510 RepID=A0A699HRE2_TANCI|nr:hypothetical protein [Tanacetum cinerariifolium]